jgi:hypothetical protein
MSILDRVVATVTSPKSANARGARNELEHIRGAVAHRKDEDPIVGRPEAASVRVRS